MTSDTSPAAASPTLLPGQRRMVLIETAVSTAINALGPALIIWLARLPAPAGLAGANGQLVVLARATFLATLLMSMIVTALVRGRTARGAPRLQHAPGSRFAPRPLVLRGLFVAAVSLLTIFPLGVLMAQGVGLGGFDRTGVLVFNLAFGVLIGVVVTPFVVLLALADAPRRTAALSAG